MSRELMPKSGIMMPHVVVNRDAAVVGVSTVDGVAGAVDLTGKYLQKTDAAATYQTKAEGASKTYVLDSIQPIMEGALFKADPFVDNNIPFRSAGANGVESVDMIKVTPENSIKLGSYESSVQGVEIHSAGRVVVVDKNDSGVETKYPIYSKRFRPEIEDLPFAAIGSYVKDSKGRTIGVNRTGINSDIKQFTQKVTFQQPVTVADAVGDNDAVTKKYMIDNATIIAESKVDSLRNDITSSDPSKGASIPVYNQTFSGSFPRSVASKLSEVYTANDVNIIGDGSDERNKLLTLINNRNGRRIDLLGKTVTISSNISLTLSEPIELINGVINYTGPMAPYAVRIYTSSSIRTDQLTIKGNFNVAKLLFCVATENTASFECTRFNAEKAKETLGTGLAAGVYITSDATKYWDKIIVDDVSVFDIDNDGTGTNVGRGVMLQNFRLAIVNRLDIRRVAPYQDADGIYSSSPSYPEATFIVDDCYFEDCQKRSVKSQIMNTRVSNIVERRTQYFTAGPGQSAVDLQAGGSLDGLTCFYAAGAVPQSIVAGGFVSGGTSLRGVSLRNVDVNCENPNDVIPRFVSFFNNSSNVYDGYVAENMKCNALIENLGFLYSNVGSTNINTYVFKDVIFRNIQASGMASTASTAVIQISRGTSNYVKGTVRVLDCNLGDGNTAPLVYLDPAPGSTSLLDVSYRQVSNSRGFNTVTPVNTDTSSRLYVVERDIAEGASTDLAIPMVVSAGRSIAKVTAIYNSTRDTQAAKLFTEGYWYCGSTTQYYIESIAGVKSQTNVGSISVSASGNNIVVSKTAGTTASGGRLTVIIEHVSSVAL